jgi:formylglycine-generating enzyme required for sulfatase activity
MYQFEKGSVKIACLLIVATFGAHLCLAQEVCGIVTRGPASGAVSAFEQIQAAVGLEPGSILLFASSDQRVKDRSGALSIQCPQGNGFQRWILYDPDLISGDLALYFALAREIAHQVNNHPMSGAPPSKQQELSADGFAARYLTRPPFNWSSEKLLQALDALPSPKEASGYPSREERRAQFLERYRETASLTNLTAGSTYTNSKDGRVYVWIPPGKFRMGCSLLDGECNPSEEPSHDVTMTKGFWIGQTEVTQEAYQKVIGSNPSPSKGARLPVVMISWNEADAYCRAVGGRLPSEAEWEYAARGGDASARYGPLDEVGWYAVNASGKLHQVAQKRANAFGLYDMLGNVLEWAADWYAQRLPVATADPRGSSSGTERTIRGGSFVDATWAQRASFRAGAPEATKDEGIGFRCAADSLDH